MKWTDVLTP